MPEPNNAGRFPGVPFGELESANRGWKPGDASEPGPSSPADLAAVARALEYQEPVWRKRVRSFAESYSHRFLPRFADPERTRGEALDTALRWGPGRWQLGSSMAAALATTPDAGLADRISLALGTMGEEVLPGVLAQCARADVQGQLRGLECLVRLVEGHAFDPARRQMVEAMARVQTGSDDSRVRQRALRVLQALGPEAEPALDAILLALADTDPGVCIAAAQALGRLRLHPERCLAGLESALASSDPEVCVAAANALGSFGTSAAPSAPRLVMSAGRPEIRPAVAATRALGRLETATEEVLRALGSNLGRSDALLRATAATAFGRLGPQAGGGAAEALVRALSDDDAFVRRSATQALAAFGALAAPGTDALIGLLRTGDEPLRVLAAEALGAIGPGAVRAVPALVAARNNNQSVMSAPVVEALQRIQADRPTPDRPDIPGASP